MRACQPAIEGHVERGGVKVAYEVLGAGEPTVMLLPTWSIIRSRHWKLQVPDLARRHQVVTFDGRGNGRSDRPAAVEAYRPTGFAADALAVMDATGTDRARAAHGRGGWAARRSRQSPGPPRAGGAAVRP
jgi:pimeloyl-ACP methyl ester carboxylesterase